MKRTQQTQKIIDHINEYLRLNHVNNEYDLVFAVITDALLKEKIYNGFNYYLSNGTLAGSTKCDYIQIW